MAHLTEMDEQDLLERVARLERHAKELRDIVEQLAVAVLEHSHPSMP